MPGIVGGGKMEEGQHQGEQGARVVGFLLVVLSAGLVVIGNLAGNVAAVQLPAGWSADAPQALVGVTVVGLIVALVLRWLQGGGRRERRSVSRMRWTIALLGVGELLAWIGGVLTNMAAPRLPASDQSLAPWLLPCVVVAIILASTWLYLRQITPSVEETNRRNFLRRLRGRYTQQQRDALSDAVLLLLGIQSEPEVVREPELAMVARPRIYEDPQVASDDARDARDLPEGTTIQQVYERADGRLLILGAPGAGKTTLLVELALWLLGPAQRDRSGNLPMPVVFNLSTWVTNRRPLAAWLVEDLEQSYQVPRKVARRWVATQAVLPLLDGFDEVDEVRQAQCAEAINAFAQRQPHLPLVVCSRAKEFSRLPITLDLKQAVMLKPLSDAQIMAYLAHGGQRLAALRAAVEADAELLDVLRAPLFLRLVTMTYAEVAEETPPAELPPLREHGAWRQRLFRDYVERMLHRERRGEEHAKYRDEDTRRYLAWLAEQMRAHRQVEFYLERLQPDWLPHAGPHDRADAIHLLPSLRWSWRGLFGGLVSGLARGLAFAPLFMLWFVLVFGLTGVRGGDLIGALLSALFFAVVFSVSLGVLYGLVRGVAGGLRPMETVGGPDLLSATAGVRGALRNAVVFGVVFGLVSGVPFGLAFGLGGKLDGYLGIGLLFGLVFGLLFGLAFGLGGRDVDRAEEMVRVRPNPVAFGPFSGLVAGLVSEVTGRVAGRLSGGLTFGLLSGLAFALGSGGGRDLVRYGALRWRLQRAGVTPPHLVGFLDYCADHVLLQRVGGGYRFVHVLLRDYFADLYDESGGTRAGKV